MECTKCKRKLNPWELLDCDDCHKSFCNDCVDDHPCGTTSEGHVRQSDVRVVVPRVLVPTIDATILREQFLALGEERWRQYIDLALHHLGKHAIDQGSGPEGLKEAFSANMERGVDYAAKCLGDSLTLTFYFELFKCCANHLETECRYRNSNDVITLGTDVKMTDDAVNELRNQHGAMRGMNSLQRDPRGDVISMNFPDFMPTCIDALFVEFHQELGKAMDAEARLLAIARLIQNLERMHPFRNANGRTNVLLLNKLLTEWGFHPVILDDPNEAPFLSLAAWRDKVRNGLFRWAIFAAKASLTRKVSGGGRKEFLLLQSARQTVRIDGREVGVGRADGSELACLFDSIRQRLPRNHPQAGLTANQLRDWLVAQYEQGRGGVVSNAHLLELRNGWMGNLANDVPALAALLQVRIRIFVRGSSGDVWLEFDSAGGWPHVIDILHHGIHFVPLGADLVQAREPEPLLLRERGPAPSFGFGSAQGLERGNAPRFDEIRIEPRTIESVPTSSRTHGSGERRGGHGTVIRSRNPSRQDEHRRVERVRSPIDRHRRDRRSPSPQRRICYFCGHRATTTVDCGSSRGCDVRRPACASCARERRDYRCYDHRH